LPCQAHGFLWLRHKHQQELRALNNQLAATQQLVQETKSAFSSAALEASNLKAQNKDLQKAIKAKGERILAQTTVALKPKDQTVEIKEGAKESVSPDNRTRVDFEKVDGNLKIKGFTLTNPAEASVSLQWLAALNLELVLTKGPEGNYRVYIDSQNAIPIALTLRVDPSVTAKRWFERINLSASASFGNSLIGPVTFGGLASVGVGYQISSKINFGLNVSAVYTGNVFLFYGATVTFYPFAK
jgi:hypothetical protein